MARAILSHLSIPRRTPSSRRAWGHSVIRCAQVAVILGNRSRVTKRIAPSIRNPLSALDPGSATPLAPLGAASRPPPFDSPWGLQKYTHPMLRIVLGIFVTPRGPRLRLSKLTVSVHLSHLASPSACCDRLKVFDSPPHAEQSACLGSQRHSLRSSRCEDIITHARTYFEQKP